MQKPLLRVRNVVCKNVIINFVPYHEFLTGFSPSALLDCEPAVFSVDLAAVETNILRFCLKQKSWTPSEFCELMAQVCEGEEAELGQEIRVLMYPHFGNSVRAVWHLGISYEDTQLAVQKMHFVTSQLLKKNNRSS